MSTVQAANQSYFNKQYLLPFGLLKMSGTNYIYSKEHLIIILLHIISLSFLVHYTTAILPLRRRVMVKDTCVNGTKMVVKSIKTDNFL